MAYMLDTDCCVELLRGKAPRAAQQLRQHGLERVCLSAISVGELLAGAARSSDPSGNSARVLRLCASFRVVPFDAHAAASYAQCRAMLSAKGTPIGPIDMLIAGHALSLGVTLVTGNTREFNRVPELSIENWIDRAS